MNYRVILYGLTGALAAGMAVLLSIQYALDQHAAATAATADLQACRAEAEQIATQRRLPATSSKHDQRAFDLSSASQSGLQAIGVTPDHLLQIQPAAPQRVGQTDYTELATTLTLRDLTLKQTVLLLLNLTETQTGLRVRSLRLSLPNNQGADVLWAVEVTLGQRVHNPAEDNGASSANIGAIQ